MEKKENLLCKAVVLLTAVVLTGCSLDGDEAVVQPGPIVCPPPTYELTRAEQQLVTESNEFAFNLFRQAIDGGNSQVLSPLSITFALGMLNNGAAGETQQQICQALGFGSTGVDSINAFCYKMLHSATELDPLTKVMIANTIYVNQPYELKPEFMTRAKVIYGAEPETRDFYDGKTMDVINQWASDHTEGMIDKLLDTINPSAVSYLLNAIYFKGNWTWKFDKELTCKETFVPDGDPLELPYVDMMQMVRPLPYAEDDEYQAVNLPYGNTAYQMTVLLPKQYGCVPSPLPTAEEWQKLCQQMDTVSVALKLPRFETKTDTDLVPIMKALGMKKAFVPNEAEFPDFCNTSTYIGMMKQSARIKVDEEGTEAAAVTTIEMTSASVPKPSYRVFHANHPFFYVISERRSGAVLFIGRFTGN